MMGVHLLMYSSMTYSNYLAYCNAWWTANPDREAATNAQRELDLSIAGLADGAGIVFG